MGEWKLETAKARLSEVVRDARSDGPQTITVRGVDTAILLSIEDYARLIDSSGPGAGSWISRLRATLVDDIELSRDSGGGRDLDF